MADEEKKVFPELEDPGKPVDVFEDVETTQEPTDNSEVGNPAESKQDVSEAENADEEKKDVPEDEDPDVQKGVSPKVRNLIRRDKRKLTAQDKRLERMRDLDEKIAQIQEEQKKLAAELTHNRDKCLNSFIFKLHILVMKKLGLKRKEDKTNADCEFDALLKEVETIIDKILIDHLKFECMVPGFEKVCEQLELKDKLDACKTKEDYREIYKKVNKRLKVLFAAEAKLKPQSEKKE